MWFPASRPIDAYILPSQLPTPEKGRVRPPTFFSESPLAVRSRALSSVHDTLLLSKHEAARLLGLSMRRLEHLISRGEIPIRRIGRRVLIARSAVESFAKAQNSTGNQESERRCRG